MLRKPSTPTEIVVGVELDREEEKQEVAVVVVVLEDDDNDEEEEEKELVPTLLRPERLTAAAGRRGVGIGFVEGGKSKCWLPPPRAVCASQRWAWLVLTYSSEE